MFLRRLQGRKAAADFGLAGLGKTAGREELLVQFGKQARADAIDCRRGDLLGEAGADPGKAIKVPGHTAQHAQNRGQGDGAQVELPAHDPAVVLAAGLEQAAQTSHVAHFAVSPVGEGDETRCAPHRL